MRHNVDREQESVADAFRSLAAQERRIARRLREYAAHSTYAPQRYACLSAAHAHDGYARMLDAKAELFGLISAKSQ